MPYDWLISGVFSTSGGRRTSRLQIRREPTQVPCHVGNSNSLCEVKRSWMVYSDTMQTPSGRATHQTPLRYNARVLFFYFMWFVTARASLFVHLVGSQTVWSCLNSVEFKQTKVSVVYFYDSNPQNSFLRKVRHPKRWIMQFFISSLNLALKKRSILRISIIFIISSTKFCNQTMRF